MTTPMSYDAILGALSAIVQTKYWPQLAMLVQMHGTPAMQKIGWMEWKASQGSNELQMYIGAPDTGIPNSHVNEDFPDTNTSRTHKLNFRYDPNELDPNKQEFRAINAVAKLDASDMDQFNNGSTKMLDLAEMTTRQTIESLNNGSSYMLFSDKHGGIGVVDGAPRKASVTWSGAGTYVAGSKTAIIKLGQKSIGAIKRDMILDFYNTSGELVADFCRVYRQDQGGDAFVIKLTSRSTVTNLDGIVDTCVIYRSGAKGHGFACSFGEISKADYSGDAASPWMGLNREDTDNMIFVPQILERIGEDPEQIEMAHLTNMSDAMEPLKDIQGNISTYTNFLGPRLLQSLRRSAEEGMIRFRDGEKNTATGKIGTSKLIHTSATLGDIELEADPFAYEDRVLLQQMERFKWLGATGQDMRVFTGNQGRGIFSNIPSTKANHTVTKKYHAAMDKVVTLTCDRMDQLAATFNVTAA